LSYHSGSQRPAKGAGMSVDLRIEPENVASFIAKAIANAGD
jgi:hypothetical protein